MTGERSKEDSRKKRRQLVKTFQQAKRLGFACATTSRANDERPTLTHAFFSQPVTFTMSRSRSFLWQQVFLDQPAIIKKKLVALDSRPIDSFTSPASESRYLTKRKNCAAFRGSDCALSSAGTKSWNKKYPSRTGNPKIPLVCVRVVRHTSFIHSECSRCISRSPELPPPRWF